MVGEWRLCVRIGKRDMLSPPSAAVVGFTERRQLRWQGGLGGVGDWQVCFKSREAGYVEPSRRGRQLQGHGGLGMVEERRFCGSRRSQTPAVGYQ